MKEPCQELPAVEDQWLSSDGYSFPYKLYQSKDCLEPPTLILCGAFQTFHSWNYYVRKFLENGKSVLLMCLPGTGESEPLPPEFGIDFLAASIRQVLDHLGLFEVSIISPSYSTPAAYLFAQQHTERVRNLILCGTMQEIPSPLQPYVAHSLTTLREGRMEQFAEEVLGLSGPRVDHGLLCTNLDKPVARRKLALRILRSQLINLSADDRLRYEYNTLRLLQHNFNDLNKPPISPTLIFTGEHDTFTKAHLSREFASKFPDAVFTTILEADHMFHLEQPEATAQLFFRFAQGYALDDVVGISDLEQFRLTPGD